MADHIWTMTELASKGVTTHIKSLNCQDGSITYQWRYKDQVLDYKLEDGALSSGRRNGKTCLEHYLCKMVADAFGLEVP